MPMLMTPTSELEAVNTMLATIGESPIDSFDENFTDATIARNLLTEESRALQNGTWAFNTELSYPLNPDADGIIHLPQNVLRVIAFSRPDLVQRGTRVYNRTTHSYVHTDSITADIVVALQFEEIPEAARRFIWVRAGRRFQDRLQGDQLLHSFQARDEQAAWTAFLNFESETAQWNIFDYSTLNARVKRYRAGAVNILKIERG